MAARMPKEAGALSIVERNRELKDLVNQTFFEGSRELRLDRMKQLMEYSMLEERQKYLSTASHQRSPQRKGYRSGYYKRTFLCGEGLIEGLRVPRTRDGKFRPGTLRRYARRSQRIDELVRRMYLNGVSTRDVGEVLKCFVDVEVSPSTVSKLAMALDTEVKAFHERSLEDDYEYLLLDGVNLKSREFGYGKRRVVLAAVGIRSDGRRELIDFYTVDSEGESEWSVFLNDLYRRGLKGRRLLLITTDGAPGIRLALRMVYPRVAHQRCWAHKLRNIANKLPKKHQATCIDQARRIYLAATRNEAVRRFWDWSKNWRSVVPGAVECLEKDLRELLAFFSVPKHMRRKVRTTNPIERAFREVRRRTRPISCFNNDRSIERIVYGITRKLNHRWTRLSERPLFAQKS
jgi:putative transposase